MLTPHITRRQQRSATRRQRTSLRESARNVLPQLDAFISRGYAAQLDSLHQGTVMGPGSRNFAVQVAGIGETAADLGDVPFLVAYTAGYGVAGGPAIGDQYVLAHHPKFGRLILGKLVTT